MKNIVLLPNPSKDKGLRLTRLVAEKLIEYKHVVYLSDELGFSLDGITGYKNFPKDAELMIVIGGDGSMLDASVLALENDIAILGVNLGKVGYLSEVEPENIDILGQISENNYKINEMMLLEATHISKGESKRSSRLAVNDVIISHNSFLGIAEFKLENSFSDYVKYRADGIILSTPQGSTAYSLSAGGAIVSHIIDSIVATPICPHSFFNRSIIFNPNEKLTLENDGKTELNVSIDGRFFTNLATGDKCVIGRANKKLKMLTFNDNNMFSTLFKKMKILEDIK